MTNNNIVVIYQQYKNNKSVVIFTFVQGLANQYDLCFSPDAINTLFDLIGPQVPYFIHLVVSQILLDPQLLGKTLAPDDIRAVYNNRVIAPACRQFFDFYRNRLKRYGAPTEQIAVTILKTVAQTSTGRASESMLFDIYQKARKKGATDIEFNELMADLEYDCYLLLDTATNEYHFQIDIMRDWWRRFYHTVSVSGKRK